MPPPSQMGLHGTISTQRKSSKKVPLEHEDDAQHNPTLSSKLSAGDSSRSVSSGVAMTTSVSLSKPLPNALFADSQCVVDSPAIESQNHRRMRWQSSSRSRNILSASGWAFAIKLTFCIFMTIFSPPVAEAHSCPGSKITAAPCTGPFHIGTSPASAQSTVWAASTDSWALTAAAPPPSQVVCVTAVTRRPFAAVALHAALVLDGSVATIAVSPVEIVVTLNINAPAARPSLLLPVTHNVITFQTPVACAPPYFFIDTSGMCIMGSTWTVIFTISPYDCIAGQVNANLAMPLIPVTSAIFSGGFITLTYPSNFFASSVATVFSAGVTSAPGMNIARGAPSSMAVVLTTSGAIINASAEAFTIPKSASSVSNLIFLTGIGLGLLVAGFCAQFISLALVTVQFSAMEYLTVRAPSFCILRLLLQQETQIEYNCLSEITPKASSDTNLLSSCQVLARIYCMLRCIPLLRYARRRPIRSTMKPCCSFAQLSRVNVSEWICSMLALFVALFPDPALASSISV